MTDYLDTIADPSSIDDETGAPQMPSSSWDPVAAEHFDRGVFKTESDSPDLMGAFDDLERDADYSVGIPVHTTSEGWDVGDWIAAEHKPRTVDSYKNEDKHMSKQTITIEALLLGAADGETSTGKDKAVAVFTPHTDTADCNLTKAGTIKVQTSDPVVMDMVNALERAEEVILEVENVTFMTDMGDSGQYNVLHSVKPA